MSAMVDEFALINVISLRPELWDTNCVQFRNRPLKNKAWEGVAQDVKSTVAECQLTWKKLRDRYTRTKRTVPHSGAEGGRKAWDKEESLRFLDKVIVKRRTHNNTSLPAPEFNNTQDDIYMSQTFSDVEIIYSEGEPDTGATNMEDVPFTYSSEFSSSIPFRTVPQAASTSRGESSSSTLSTMVPHAASTSRGESSFSTPSTMVPHAASTSTGESSCSTPSRMVPHAASTSRAESSSSTPSRTVLHAASTSRGESSSSTPSRTAPHAASTSRGESSSSTPSRTAPHAASTSRGESTVQHAPTTSQGRKRKTADKANDRISNSLLAAIDKLASADAPIPATMDVNEAFIQYHSQQVRELLKANPNMERRIRNRIASFTDELYEELGTR